jgi:ferredoxin
MFLHSVIVGEESPLRKFLLFIFARFIEVPLLKMSYRLLRGDLKRIGDIPLFRKAMGVLLARPFGYLGDTGKPVPFDTVLEYIDTLDGPIAVGPCRCRIGHRACDHPLETDIVLRTGYDAWTRAFPKEYRTITKDEAKEIVTRCHELQMMHMVFIHCPVNLYNEYVICNCCTCGCVPYIINRDLGQLNYPLIDGYFLAETDRTRCKGCSDCVTVCPFDARVLTDKKSRTAHNCYGCGLCASVCPEKAIAMKEIAESPPRDEDGREPSKIHPSLFRQHPPITEDR